MFADTMFTDLLRQLNELRREVDTAFTSNTTRQSGTARFPSVNIFSTDDNVMVTAEVPGVDPDSIDISAYRDTLTIKGERTLGDAAEGEEWHRRERRSGRFARTLRLPYHIDHDSVQAKVKDGVLAIAVNRPEADKPRRISVDVA